MTPYALLAPTPDADENRAIRRYERAQAEAAEGRGPLAESAARQLVRVSLEALRRIRP